MEKGVLGLNKQNTDLLASPWIRIDPNIDWDHILTTSNVRVCKKGDVIINAGDSIESLYFLKSGRIKTIAISSSGNQKIMWYIDHDCFFGETPFFNHKTCDYIFVADTECEIYIFPREIVQKEIIPNHSDITLSIIETLARKVHILSTQVEDFTFSKAIIRIAKVIYFLYEGYALKEKKVPMKIPLTQEIIAEMVGIHRVTVNQVLKQFKSQQILEEHSHLIIIKNLEKLKEIICSS